MIWRFVRRTVVLAIVVVAITPWVAGLAYRWLPVPITPLMIVRAFDGHGLAKSWRPFDQISPHLAQAVIAAEDNHFCSHHGVDWLAVRDAVDEYRDGDRLRGASTITMQTTKNVILYEWRNPARKLIEAYGATVFDVVLPKPRILEIYLNVAEWAPGVYGAEAAARHHFGKAASDLSANEAALLAAILPNPRQWSANPPSEYIAGRARSIERGVVQLGPLLDCARPA